MSLRHLALCLGAVGLLVACEAPAKKVALSDDTSTIADTAVDATDTGGDSTSGDTSEDTSPDGTDTAPDTLTDTAEPPATCDEQLGLLPSTDCGCGGQLICRDQAAAPQCVGALPENACGGCGGIAVEIGAGCGFCGDGVWTCDAANPDAPTCVGATPQNSCGGCTTLPGIEGDSCSADGFFLCVTEEELVCVGPGQNACGGFAALGEALGGPCGECGAGRFVCDGTDAVRCEEAAEPRNACGGCGTLPNRVGDDCGDCDGTWACDPSNPDGLICSQTRNVCGSCGSPGAGALGEACTGGRLVCGADGQLSCESNDRNLCGGTTALSAAPGTDCGSCGGVNICAGLERVVCIGSAPVNGCGGCGFLPAFPGTFCGVDHTWECNADGTMDCARTTSSVVVSDAVGGTTVVDKGQVTVPAGAVTDPIRITIRVRNGMMIPGYQLTSPVLEFGPAGTEFAQPLEVQIISDDAPASDMVWSNRATEGGGYSEVSGATVEGDALVGDVNHFSIGFTGIPLADTELCGDGRDNDGDALADCDDSDCAAVPGCASVGVEECGNGIDDDRDLFVDCDDSDCIGEIGCGEPPVESCNDGVDNDSDGMMDCADADCASDPNCGGCASITCPVSGEVCGIGPEGPVCYRPCAGDADCGAGEVCTVLGCAADSGSDAGLDGGSDAGGDTGGGGEGGLCLNPFDQLIFGTTDMDTATLTCGVTCLSDVNPAGCAATCIEAETGLSAGCAGCQGAQTACLITNCLSFCSADPSGVPCETCNLNFCQADYAFCSGAGGPESNCNDGLDNNLNGSADCSDPVCAVDRTCTFGCAELGCPSGQECVSNACIPATRELDCGDGLDDDGDGLADCIDADCTYATECTNLSGACSNETDGNVFYGGTYVGAFSCLPRAPFQEPLVAPCVIAQTRLSPACADCMAAYVICVASSANDNACTQAVRDCSGIPFVVGETCGNGVDDDGNRQVDCVDSDCSTEPECQLGAVAEVCTDGTDNDGDSLIDCRDFDCAVACVGVPENCSDGFDDNGNGVRDCYETSCASDPSCTEEICGNGLDDNGNGSTDCADDDCAGAAACVESVCDDSSDNDSDGLTDCGDDDCAGAAACVESVCDDSTDNDGDGLTDCADADCFDQLSEDADDGSVPSEWTTSADTATTAAWGFTTVGALAGNSLRSGVIPDSGVSELTIPSPNRGAGRITFWWKTDTERSYDFFSVLFGTTLTWTRQSGVNAWSQTTLTVPANTPSITFRYSKDGSDLSGADAVWVDQIAWVAGAATCFPETCDNSIDDNANGLVDCADSDCADAVGCVETACNDYRDDEGDGAVDCLDSDCEGSVQCQELCDDEVDNDGDGLVDCFDVACRGSAACPVQSCLGVAFPGATAPYSGYRYGYSPTGCAPGEGCSLRIPGEPSTYGSWGGQQLYAGVCSAARTSGQSCGIGSAAGYCGDSTHGAGCMGGLCRGGEVPSYYGPESCGAGQTALSALAADGSAYSFCAPVALGAASGESCGESVTKYCTGALECRSLDSLAPTRSLGICVGSASSPAACPAGTAWRYEWSSSGGRKGLCLPYAGTGESCGASRLCDASAGLVCGAAGTCRPVVVGEGCATATALEPNTSGIGPDYFTVDRLDGLTEADESLNCSGTVGPEKVYFYTATSPVELAIEVGSVDGNGPLLSWYGRKETCTDIFAEAACGNASLLPTSGKIRLQSGETVYLTVDSAARWAGGDSAAAEFFLTVSERPVANEGGSCAAAVCDEGLNCAPSGICAAPSCGDALVDTGETCDDGNAVDGDGCTDCDIDVYAETERNDTQATANRVGSARRVSGTAANESDYFCAPLGPHGGRITIRNISAGSCNLYLNSLGLPCEEERTLTFTTPEGCFGLLMYASDPYLIELKVDPFTELGEGESCGPTLATGAACGDIGGAPAVCRENSPRVHAGTCELSTCGDGYTDAAEGEQCDDGNTTVADGCSSTCLRESYDEVEPNNGNLTARNIGGYRKISGTIAATTDYDYYKFTLAKRSHLEFAVDSAAFPGGTGSLRVELTSPSSTVVFSEVLTAYVGYGGARGGGGFGGSVYRAQALAFVEPGTYTLRLAAEGTATGSYVFSIRDVPTSVAPIGAACDPLTFEPCLDGLQCGLSTRTCATPVCGDGINTVNEACDDGNRLAGDGCDASCAVESLAFEQVSTDSRTPTSLTGIGTEYPFPDGSVVRVIELANIASYERYVSFELTEPTRIRALNLGAIRIWKTASGTELSPVGTQVAAPASYLPLVAPAWLGPLLDTPTISSWDCDGAPEDGVCQDATGGTDCLDCGARYGVDPGSKWGFDLLLPEGTYTLKLTWDGSARSIWLVLGESPAERAQ